MRPGAKKESGCTFSASKFSLLLPFLAFVSFMPYAASGEESSLSQAGQNILVEDWEQSSK